jgi:hypothetical protein
VEQANRSLLGPVYVEGRRVQFWYVDYDPATDAARLGYELVAMHDQATRESLGETWYPFAEARPLLHPSMWELACTRLAELRGGRP